jgi:hypothetical protein
MSSRDDYPTLAGWAKTSTGFAAQANSALAEIDRLCAENLALQREMAGKFGAAANVAPTALEVVRAAVEARGELGLDASPRVHALRAAIDKHLAS